jgi:hypothetical protein
MRSGARVEVVEEYDMISQCLRSLSFIGIEHV